MRVEVEVMVDGGKARDDGLQAAGVFLDQPHDGHQPSRRLSLRALVSAREEDGVLFAHAVEGRKHRLGVHHCRQLRRGASEGGGGGGGGREGRREKKKEEAEC